MDMSLDVTGSLENLQREQIILEVMELMVHGRDENGKPFGIQKACDAAGISYLMWRKWVKEGYTDGPLRETSKLVSQIAYDAILPHYEDIIGGLVNIALGKRPDGVHPSMEIKASDIRGAIKDIHQIIPIKPIDENTGGAKSEFEHIEQYQPKQLMDVTIIQTGDHIYQSSDHDRVGDLASIKDEIEGRFVEIESPDK